MSASGSLLLPAKPGVNTGVFGRLQWPIIHGAAYILQQSPAELRREAAPLFATMLRAVQKTMPCRFCRRSFRHFLEEEMEATGVTAPEQWVDGGTVFDVTVSLHDRVSAKLDCQRYKVCGLRSRRVPDETLLKVHRALTSYYTPRVVFDLLMIYAYNLDVLCEGGDGAFEDEACDVAEARAALCDLVQVMAPMLRIQAEFDARMSGFVTPEARDCLHAAAAIERASAEMREDIAASSSSALFDSIFSLYLTCAAGEGEGEVDIEAARDAVLVKLLAAASHQCAQETCV